MEQPCVRELELISHLQIVEERGAWAPYQPPHTPIAAAPTAAPPAAAPPAAAPPIVTGIAAVVGAIIADCMHASTVRIIIIIIIWDADNEGGRERAGIVATIRGGCGAVEGGERGVLRGHLLGAHRGDACGVIGMEVRRGHHVLGSLPSSRWPRAGGGKRARGWIGRRRATPSVEEIAQLRRTQHRIERVLWPHRYGPLNDAACPVSGDCAKCEKQAADGGGEAEQTEAVNVEEDVGGDAGRRRWR